jgi:hypothetical protein
MRDRLGECRAAQSLIARLALPLDREVVESGFSEVMGDGLWLGAAIAEEFRGAAMQRLSAALQEAFVGRVLDQRMLEAIGRLRRGARCEEDIRLGEPIQCCLQRRLIPSSDVAQQPIRELAPEHGPDLGGLARFA